MLMNAQTTDKDRPETALDAAVKRHLEALADIERKRRETDERDRRPWRFSALATFLGLAA